MPYCRRAVSTDRPIADAGLVLDLVGLPYALGSRSARSPYSTFYRASFTNLVAVCTEVREARYWCPGRHCRQLTEHVAAAPHGLDVVAAAGGSGNFFSQCTNQNLNDFRLWFIHPTVKVIEKHPLCQDGSFTQAE